jgi:ATP adenylyltransferase
MDEIMSLADTTMNILRDTMKAQGFNFGANIGIAAGAGLADHIHFHIVPRWVGDTNFMPIVGHTKVMVDGLLETYDKLKLEFNKVNK